MIEEDNRTLTDLAGGPITEGQQVGLLHHLPALILESEYATASRASLALHT